MTKSPAPRYDRIASLVLVIALGLAVVLLIDINPNILQAQIGGDFPIITISWPLIGLLMLIASTGADIQARSHPQMQTRTLPTINLGFTSTEVAPGFWFLPAFSVAGSFAFFRLFSDTLQGGAFVLALVGTGALLLTVLTAQHYALDRNPEISQRARFVLQITTYLLAFAWFSAVYFERFRTLYAATLIGGAGALLAYEILRWLPRRSELPILSLGVGLLVAEATWALNYWQATFLIGGALLLLVFYVVINLLYHHLQGTLQRRLVVEYSVLSSVLLVVIVYLTFF